MLQRGKETSVTTSGFQIPMCAVTGFCLRIIQELQIHKTVVVCVVSPFYHFGRNVEHMTRLSPD